MLLSGLSRYIARLLIGLADADDTTTHGNIWAKSTCLNPGEYGVNSDDDSDLGIDSLSLQNSKVLDTMNTGRLAPDTLECSVPLDPPECIEDPTLEPPPQEDSYDDFFWKTKKGKKKLKGDAQRKIVDDSWGL